MLKLKLCKFDAGCNVSTVDCRLHDTELWTIVIGQEGQHGRSSSDRRVSTDDRHRTGGSARTIVIGQEGQHGRSSSDRRVSTDAGWCPAGAVVNTGHLRWCKGRSSQTQL